MNKHGVLQRVSAITGIPQNKCEEVLKATAETIISELKSGNYVAFKNFGVFKVEHKSGMRGFNFATGEDVYIPERDVPVFQAGKAFKERVVNDV